MQKCRKKILLYFTLLYFALLHCCWEANLLILSRGVPIWLHHTEEASSCFQLVCISMCEPQRVDTAALCSYPNRFKKTSLGANNGHPHRLTSPARYLARTAGCVCVCVFFFALPFKQVDTGEKKKVRPARGQESRDQRAMTKMNKWLRMFGHELRES